MSVKQSGIGNRLLSVMSGADFDCLAPHLQTVRLRQNDLLATGGAEAPFCYFPTSGICSIVAAAPGGRGAEVGLVGREGVLPVWPLLGSRAAPHEIVVQVAGEGYRIPAEVLVTSINARPSMRLLLLRFVQTLWTQTAFTALTNTAYRIDERLARWALMCHDRTDGDRVSLTHEYVAQMLAVRRASVTEALHILEGLHLIYSERGTVIVRDREGLKRFAHGGYGIPEAEYSRLIDTPD